MAENQLSKLKGMDTVFLYYVLLTFFLVCASWVFGPRAYVFKDMIIVYAISFLIFTKRDPDIKGASVLQTLPMNMVYTLAVIFVIGLLPIQSMGLYDDGVIFAHWIIAFLWYVGIVGYTETLIFAKGLPESIGSIASSALFALFHTQTILIVNRLISLTEMDMVFLFVKLFAMNMLFIMIYKYSRSVYLTALVHGCIDLAKIGMLSIITWGLFT